MEGVIKPTEERVKQKVMDPETTGQQIKILVEKKNTTQ